MSLNGNLYIFSVDYNSINKSDILNTKDINVKTFDMITNKNEANVMTKHVSCD